MTQLSVMELAKKGDPQAIATLINRSLESKGIHATADLEGECLTISLQASQIPNQKAVITIIQRGMMILRVEQIQSVKVLTYRSDNNYLAWQHQFSLTPSYDKSLPSSEIQSSANLVQDQNMNLVSNPKEVILVQKLSQIQQNLQEYQDVIVRFTDEHVGNVRCLTTLTELIQVISKPSFLFATVASNPNLRSLLDTIAESSDTDEHGDQVITNLSILQPGQQWQKAKIRLVTKIFLEPAQDQENAEVKHQGLTLDLQDATPQVISEIEKTNLNSQENVASVNESEGNQSDSLFNDFLDTSVSSPIPVDTSTANQSDELFNDFPDTSSIPSTIPVTNSEANQSDSLFIVQPVVHQINDETVPTSLDDDLFNDFSFSQSQKSPEDNNSISLDTPTTIEESIDVIKSKIPKQRLNQLLRLLDEEDLTNTESLSNSNQNYNTQPAKVDMGATTIEQILENMETIPLNDVDPSSSSSILTLEDFSQDIGF